MGHRDAVRQSTRSYFLKVLLWIPISGLIAAVAMFLLGQLLPDAPGVMGVAGILAMLGVVGGALAIYRANVRCPACGAWLVPVGMNGFTPRSCPACKVDLRT